MRGAEVGAGGANGFTMTCKIDRDGYCECDHLRAEAAAVRIQRDHLQAEVERFKDQGKTAVELFDHLKEPQKEARDLELQLQEANKALNNILRHAVAMREIIYLREQGPSEAQYQEFAAAVSRLEDYLKIPPRDRFIKGGTTDGIGDMV